MSYFLEPTFSTTILVNFKKFDTYLWSIEAAFSEKFNTNRPFSSTKMECVKSLEDLISDQYKCKFNHDHMTEIELQKSWNWFWTKFEINVQNMGLNTYKIINSICWNFNSKIEIICFAEVYNLLSNTHIMTKNNICISNFHHINFFPD